MSTCDTFLIKSDQLVKITGVTDASTGTAINDATGTASVFAHDESTDTADLSTQVGSDATLSYIAASSGDYSAVFPETLGLIEGKTYWVRVKLVKAGFNREEWRRVTAVIET